MPSDARLAKALDALSALFAQYRSAVAATLEDVRGHVTLHSADGPGRTAQLTTELGEFAAGRIDVARLGGLLGETTELAPATLERLERAAMTLRNIAARGDALMHVQVAPGEDLTTVVRARFAEIGRAFGAARVAAAQSSASAMTRDEEKLLTALPFREWTAAERRLAPPLVVSLQGADFHPAGLAEFLDGLQKIVLLVDGACPPAALVRLITPGVFVAQSQDAAICSQVANWPGAAIAALVPESSVQFVHDPSAGPELWQRVKVQSAVPDPKARVSGLSSAQQIDELRQLEALAHAPAAQPASAAVPDGSADPVDRLAAWLLRQADLTEPAGGN
jgi:hypothetical protein